MDNVILDLVGIISGCDNLAQLDYAKGDITACLAAYFPYLCEDAIRELAVEVMCVGRINLNVNHDDIFAAIYNFLA